MDDYDASSRGPLATGSRYPNAEPKGCAHLTQGDAETIEAACQADAFLSLRSLPMSIGEPKHPSSGFTVRSKRMDDKALHGSRMRLHPNSL